MGKNILLFKAIQKHQKQGTLFLGLLTFAYRVLGLNAYFFTKNVKREARRVSKHISSGQLKSAILVFDNFSSPPTYGDFTDLLMLGRYFQARNITVKFFLLSDGFRLDWCDFDNARLKRHLDEQMEIASAFLGQVSCESCVTSYDDMVRWISNDGSSAFIPFEHKTRSRIGFYEECLMLLPLLYNAEPADNKMLLDKSLKSTLKPTSERFVTWHVRAGGLWSLDRNISEHEFLEQYSKIRALLSQKTRIIVVTGYDGYNFLKPIAYEHSLDLTFSKDRYKTFLDDAVLTLASNLYIQLGGGGLFTIPAHSLTPYYLTTQMHAGFEQERYRKIGLGYRKGKLKPWATEDQIIENSPNPNWQVLANLVRKLDL